MASKYRASDQSLVQENREYRGTAGVSEGNRSFGFVPAFLDTRTGNVYRSRFADGRPAPLHVLDGLPMELRAANGTRGKSSGLEPCVVSGFLRADRFYTREQAAQAVSV